MSVGGSDGSGPCSRQSGTALDLELAEFARALTAEGEVGLSTIRQYRSHLNSTVADSAQESVAALLAHPVDAVAAIRAPASQQARRCRHLVIHRYVRLFPPPTRTQAALEAALTRLPGRVATVGHSLDRSLGGSLKRTRRRHPLTLLGIERMIDAASKLQRRSALYRARAGALVVSHALTTLRPAEALALRWERLQPWPVVVDGLARLEEGRRPVIAELALSVLRTLWNLHGRPSSGEVFKSREGGHLAGRYASELLNEVFAAAALPPIDRRHLRAPLLWWLVHVVGWDLLPVGWAAGFRHTHQLRSYIRPLEEWAAQSEATELLVIDESERLPAATRSRAELRHGTPGAPEVRPTAKSATHGKETNYA